MDGDAIEVHFDEYRYYFEVPDVPGPGMHQIVISANIERYNPDRKFTATIDPDQGETGNTVTLDGGGASHEYHEGDTVHVSIDWQAETKFREPISAKYVEDGEEKSVELTPSVEENDHTEQYTFLMPRAAVSISCSFEPVGYDITYEMEFDDPRFESLAEYILETPTVTVDNTSYELPRSVHPGKTVTVTCAVNEEYAPIGCCTAVTTETPDGHGGTVTRQLDAEVTKPNRTLTASFEMPPSNVKLKLRVSFVYLVYIDDASKDYVKSDTKYAAEGDRVKLTLNDNGPFSPAAVSAETSQTYQNVPIGDDREFVMPDDHVIISATITATRPDAAKDKEQSYVYTVTGPDNTRLTVALVLGQGETAGTAVIAKLPAGTYTVTEERSWSWRYSDGGTSTVTAAPNGIAETVFDHSLDLREWLNGYSHLQPSLTHP